MSVDELQRLLANGVYQRHQAARALESVEQQYRQFLSGTFIKGRARALNSIDRQQYEQALAGYRLSYENARHALREMDWITEQLEAQIQAA